MFASFLIITGVPVLPMMLRHRLLSLLDNLQEINVLLDGFLNHLQVQEPLKNQIRKLAFLIGNLAILKNLRYILEKSAGFRINLFCKTAECSNDFLKSVSNPRKSNLKIRFYISLEFSDKNSYLLIWFF